MVQQATQSSLVGRRFAVGGLAALALQEAELSEPISTRFGRLLWVSVVRSGQVLAVVFV